MIDADDRVTLRRASVDDLEAVLSIRRALPMPSAAETHRGGFLLDTDAASYAQLLACARVWLLELDAAPVGFCVTLDDALLRSSPIWARREHIAWQPDFDAARALTQRIAYFDQIAVLPSLRARSWGAVLALRALAELTEELDHDLVLTTTVCEPIVNHAALPYLARVGARECGRLEEHDPGVGRLVSAIHVIEAGPFRERLAHARVHGRPALRRVIARACPEAR